METTTISILIGLTVTALSILFVFVKAYTVCPSDMLLIVNGKRSKPVDGNDASGGAQVYQGGSAWVIPFLFTKSWLSLKPMSMTVSLENALTRNNVPIDISMQLMFAVSTDERESIQNAIRYWVNTELRGIKDEIEEISKGTLRSIIAELDIEELISDRDAFTAAIHEAFINEFKKVGMKLVSHNIRDITDKHKYIESLGAKAAATVRELALSDTAAIERDAKITQETALTLRENGVNHQIRIKEIRNVEIDREKQVSIADNKYQEATAVANLDQKRAVELSKINADTADQTKENMLREHQASTQREVGIAKLQAETFAAQQAAKIAEESSNQLVQIEIDNRRQQMIAKNEADIIRISAEANAADIKLVAEAKAAAIELELTAKSVGYNKLIDSCGTAGAVNQLMITESIEKLAEINATALANLKIDNIALTGGGSSDSGSPIASLIKDFVSSMPEAHLVAKAHGIDLPALFGKPNKASSESTKPLENAVSTNHIADDGDSRD